TYITYSTYKRWIQAEKLGKIPFGMLFCRDLGVCVTVVGFGLYGGRFWFVRWCDSVSLVV
ncbi:MAG: hypothetical protein ACLSDO_09300, partial [Anaerotruncus colihominis]